TSRLTPVSAGRRDVSSVEAGRASVVPKLSTVPRNASGADSRRTCCSPSPPNFECLDFEPADFESATPEIAFRKSHRLSCWVEASDKEPKRIPARPSRLDHTTFPAV